MAPPRGGLKGTYRQRKKGSGAAGVAKSSPKRKFKNAKPQHGVAEEDQYGAEEEALRQFDMDMSYGPCVGVTRLRRWERAAAMGLRPPPHVRDLILRHHHGDGPSSLPPKNDDSSHLHECL